MIRLQIKSQDLKEENTDLKEENKDLKEENKGLKEENQGVKEENQDLRDGIQELTRELRIQARNCDARQNVIHFQNSKMPGPRHTNEQREHRKDVLKPNIEVETEENAVAQQPPQGGISSLPNS